MVEIKSGDICEANAEVIVCTTNSTGFAAKGTSRRIIEKAGKIVELEIKNKCQNNKSDLKVGSCFETSSGDLLEKGIKRICHAVITPLPGDLCSSSDLNKILKTIFQLEIRYNRKSVAMPAFGLEEKNADAEIIAIFMSRVIKNYSSTIDIQIIDNNKEFIEKIKHYLL